MLSSDCTATSGSAPRAASRPEATKAVGIAGPKPATVMPANQASASRTPCMARTGTRMTRVLASATAAGECGVVRIAFQLVPRCSTRHTVEASRAIPREQNIIE